MSIQKVVVCDRCGKQPILRQESNLHVLDTRKGNSRLDLCDSCYDKLEEFLQGALIDTKPPFNPDDPKTWSRCHHNIPCAGPCNSE